MKQLKKISLQKEELMSLNAPQMDSIKGGTSPLTSSGPCAAASSEMCSVVVAITTEYIYKGLEYTYEYVTGYFNGGGNNGGGNDHPDAEYISQYYEEGACMMPPIYVTP